jgi:hypothetical protein
MKCGRKRGRKEKIQNIEYAHLQVNKNKFFTFHNF